MEKVQAVVRPLTTKSAFLVEDDPKASVAVAKILNELGYDVTTCSSGVGALDVIRSGSFDLLLTDFELGGEIDGLMLLKEMRKIAPETEAILMSGKLLARELALDDVILLEKPVTQTKLVTALLA